jgi:hypothetical protein
MKSITYGLLLFLVFVATSQPVVAGECGRGKVLTVMEGGWNTPDLFIKISYTSPSSHPGTEYSGFIRYRKSNLEPDRFKGIKAIALMAYITKESIWTYSHAADCSNATEIGIGQR